MKNRRKLYDMYSFPYSSIITFSLHNPKTFDDAVLTPLKKQHKVISMNQHCLTGSNSYSDLCSNDNGNNCCAITNQLSNKDFIYKLQIPNHML